MECRRSKGRGSGFIPTCGIVPTRLSPRQAEATPRRRLQVRVARGSRNYTNTADEQAVVTDLVAVVSNSAEEGFDNLQSKMLGILHQLKDILITQFETRQRGDTADFKFIGIFVVSAHY